MSIKLSLTDLLHAGLDQTLMFEAEEREELAEAIAASVKERTLQLLMDDDMSRELGERLQAELLGGDDLLQAAVNIGVAGEEPFAEAFSVALAAVLDELIEVSEEQDATQLRKRLHGAVTEALHERILSISGDA